MKNNQVKFRIYYISADGNKVATFESTADSREDIYKIYTEYKNIVKDDNEKYYYEIINNFSILKKDGSIVECESLSNIPDKDNDLSLFSKLKSFLEDIEIYISAKFYRLKHLKYIFDDFVFWIKNYNSVNNTSHMRSELWSIDYHILEDLVFNIDKMIKLINNKKCGIADKYLIQARKILQEEDENYKVPDEILNCYSYTDKEFDLGRNIWIDELDNFLHKIGIYNYLVAYGHFSKEDYSKYHMYADVEFYKNIIPMHEGTLNDIKYDELRIKIDKYWNEIWDWIKENGRDLWT